MFMDNITICIAEPRVLATGGRGVEASGSQTRAVTGLLAVGDRLEERDYVEANCRRSKVGVFDFRSPSASCCTLTLSFI